MTTNKSKAAFLVLSKPPTTFAAKCDACKGVMYLGYDDVSGMIATAEGHSINVYPLCQDCFKKHLGEEAYQKALLNKETSVYTALREKDAPFQCERCEEKVHRDPLFGPSVEAFKMPIFCIPCVQKILGVTTVLCECGCGRNILESSGTVVLDKAPKKNEMVQ